MLPLCGAAGRASSRPTHIIQAEERGNDLFVLIYIYSNGLFDVWIPGNEKLTGGGEGREGRAGAAREKCVKCCYCG